MWDPRARLTEAARRFLAVEASHGIRTSGLLTAVNPGDETADSRDPADWIPVVEVVAAEVRALLAAAYAAGRRAEGLHGSGLFSQGFRRLEAHPDFPAVAVGFGPGTTPAGDDWLAGCLVALDLRAGGPGLAAPGLRERIRGRLEQTTSAGRALLLGALAGAPPEYLVGLAEAATGLAVAWLSAPAAGMESVAGQTAGQAQGLARLRDAVSNCLEHGATSGEDALAGFVYGLGADRKLVESELDYEPSM